MLMENTCLILKEKHRSLVFHVYVAIVTLYNCSLPQTAAREFTVFITGLVTSEYISVVTSVIP